MITDSHIPIRLPYGNEVPPIDWILKRLRKLYPETHKYLLPMLTTCAEESEKIMLELFLSEQKPVVHLKEIRTPAGYLKKMNYQCPKCKTDSLNRSYHHCPNCGSRLEWH